MGVRIKAELRQTLKKHLKTGWRALCPEVPGANGQGGTIEATKKNLRQAVALIFEDRKGGILRGLPDDGIQGTVMVG